MNCADLGDLAARSDVITLHLPLTDQTRHLAGEAFLARVKPGAILVNCGRGWLIDTDAVWRALTSVLDVLGGREPQAVADPAWRTHRAVHPGGHPAGHPRTKEIPV